MSLAYRFYRLAETESTVKRKLALRLKLLFSIASLGVHVLSFIAASIYDFLFAHKKYCHSLIVSFICEVDEWGTHFGYLLLTVVAASLTMSRSLNRTDS